MAQSFPISEMPGVAGAVYQVGSKVIVKDFASRIRSKRVYQGILGTNDHAALQYAQDNIVGDIYVGPGTYYWPATQVLRLKNKTKGSGIDKTIFKTANGLLNDCRTLIEMESYTGLSHVTIDGNQANNDNNWATFAETPFQQGIYTSTRNTNPGTVPAYSIGCCVHDVKIKDTIKTNLVIAGYRHNIYNLFLDTSLWDHALYFSAAYGNRVKNIDIQGYHTNEIVCYGTDSAYPANQNLLEDVYFHDLVKHPTVARQVTNIISVRSTAGTGKDNVIRNIRMDIPDLTAGGYTQPILYASHQPGTILDGLQAEVATSNNTCLMFFSGVYDGNPNYQFVRNVDIELAASGISTYAYFLWATEVQNLWLENIKVSDNAADSYWRGLRVAPTHISNTTYLKNVVFGCPNRLAVFIPSNPYTVTVYGDTEIKPGRTWADAHAISLGPGVRVGIMPGEIRAYKGSIGTLTQDAYNSLDCPFSKDVALLALDIYVSTGATATSPNIDCGIGASAEADYTNLFDDLPGETIGLYNSKIATPGTQTQPVLWQSGAGSRYLNMSIKDAAATGMVATYVATVMGL